MTYLSLATQQGLTCRARGFGAALVAGPLDQSLQRLDEHAGVPHLRQGSSRILESGTLPVGELPPQAVLG